MKRETESRLLFNSGSDFEFDQDLAANLSEANNHFVN